MNWMWVLISGFLILPNFSLAQSSSNDDGAAALTQDPAAPTNANPLAPIPVKDRPVKNQENSGPEHASEPTSHHESNRYRWQFAAGLSYESQYSAIFNSTTQPGALNNFNVNKTYAAGFGVNGDVRYMPDQGWGFIGGVNYLGQVALVSQTIAGNGSYINSSINNPEQIQITLASASGAYKWRGIYVVAGLNYDYIVFTPSGSFSGNYSVTGGVGGQVGAGYFFTPNIIAEAIYRSAAITLSQTSSNYGQSENFGTTYVNNFGVGAKWMF